MTTFIQRTLAASAVVSTAAVVAQAQTPISGNLSGSLGPGVYHVTAPIAVQSGQTLTLAAGTTFKFGNGGYFYVQGTLDANGTSGSPVVFTDIRDDTAGGDTNGDGAGSSPAAGWWYGVEFQSNASASTLDYLEVRYPGYGGWAGIRVSTVSPAFANCKVRNGSSHGLDFLSTSAFPTVASCVLENNAAAAITGVRFDALAGFTSNTATGNGRNALEVVTNSIAANVTVGPNNGINGAIYSNGPNNIPAAATVTLQAGLTVKWNNGGYMYVAGILDVNGSSGSKVTFTDARDDTLGGDTNGDGAGSSPAAGWWYGLELQNSASTLDHFDVRYAGYGGWAGLRVNASAPALTNCKVSNGAGAGLDLMSTTAYPTVTSCTLQANAGSAIRGVRFDALPGFGSNTATGNGANHLLVEQATIALDVTVGPSDGINGAVQLTTPFNIPAGRTVNLQGGLTVKYHNGGYSYVDGTLNAVGSSGNNVVFTDSRDDTSGGDSNGDGNASVPAAGWWYGLIFRVGSDASVLDFTETRYAGYGGYSGLRLEGAISPTITRSIVRNGAADGISCVSSAATPRINRCLITNNAGSAISGVAIDAVPFITRNTATGNGLNRLYVTDCSLAGDVYIDGTAGVNDAIVLAAALLVPNATTLRLGPGATFKFHNGGYLGVNGGGNLIVEGTAADPVMFGDHRDDTLGGDTNGDGAGSSPAGGWWYGVIFYSGSAGDVEHAVSRHAGYGGYAGFRSQSPNVSMRHCRSESSGAEGFQIYDAARGEHLTVWNSTGFGIRLLGGSFDLRQATVTGATSGIVKDGAGWTGSVVDSISWGNTTNYLNLVAANVRYSNGFVGGTGNINANPLFVNAGTGNLNLQGGSPCINTGDPFSPLDPNCTRADMGAYPTTSAPAPATYCAGKANSAGCTPFMAFSGFASDSSSAPFHVRAFSVLNNKTGIFYYGLNGAANSPFQGGTKCVAPPTKRLPLMNSGGNAGGSDCSGIFEIDFNAHIQSNIDAQLIPGATVNMQCWYRDPAVGSATGLSNGLQFDICN